MMTRHFDAETEPVLASCGPEGRFSYLRLGRNLKPLREDAGWRRGGPMEHARFDMPLIHEWAVRGGNLGVRTGRQSSIFVLDVDPRNGGDESLAGLVEEHGPLPATYTVRTGRGGCHFYFFVPAYFEVRSSTEELAPGLDIKGERSFVVAPGSIKPTGERYEVESPAKIAHAPDWLVDWLRAQTEKRAQRAEKRASRAVEAAGKVEHPEECCEDAARDAVASIVKVMDRLRTKPENGRVKIKGKPRGWDEGYFLLGTRLAQVALWPYTTFSIADAEQVFFEHAPDRDGTFGPEHKWDDAVLRAEGDPWNVGEDHRIKGHGPSAVTLLARKEGKR